MSYQHGVHLLPSTIEEQERQFESGTTSKGVIETKFGRIFWEAERVEDQDFMNWLSKKIINFQKQFKTCHKNSR